MDRRDFFTKAFAITSSFTILGQLLKVAAEEVKDYDASKHYYGMGIQIDKCIGCGRCVEA